MIAKAIPEVHNDSDAFYWKEIFPFGYSIRTKYILKSDEPEYADLMLDGDFHTDTSQGETRYVCNRCNVASGWKPRLFGSLDVGFELIYECKNCRKGKMRVYTPVIEID
ncbi:MAG: hypothetical protein J5725_00220 [Bacteroidales bacterium]|nr:hypothetical protein [Bacteroidales bacterium]